MNGEFDERYLNWLMELVGQCPLEHPEGGYFKLLHKLASEEFVPTMQMDKNRAVDGVMLRDRYVKQTGEYPMQGDIWPVCSMLELMVGMAVRCEEDIMDRPGEESRVPVWFWNMVESMGLLGMTDTGYSDRTVENAVTRVNYRTYDVTGRLGLFTLSSPPSDMRRAELWYQMNWWLNEYIEMEEN